MSQRFSGLRMILAAWLVGLAVFAVPATAAADDAQLAGLSELSADHLWQLGVDQIARGQFAGASATFDRLLDLSPDNTSAEQVRKWLGSYEDLDARRQVVRRHECEKHARYAQQRIVQTHLAPYWKAVFKEPFDVLSRIEKSDLLAGVHWPDPGPLAFSWRAFRRFNVRMMHVDWTDALAEARYAFLNADDQDEFRREPWLDTLVSESIAGAEADRGEREWSQAAGIYYELSEIFPKDKGFKEALEECTRHARLEQIYKAGGDWQNNVKSIDRGMLFAVLDRINQDYVEEPDFREITRSGLKALLLAVKSHVLKESYPALKDEALVEHIEKRLEALLRRTERQEGFGYDQCTSFFRSALQANQESVVLPEGLVTTELTDGALSALDEFSSVIWPSDIDDFKKYTVGEFYGVGISINMQGGKITVFSPLEDTPAYDAGIQPGDVITKVDGESTKDFSLNQAVDKITGPEGTFVTLTIQRRGGPEEVDVRLRRAKITIHTVKGVQRDATGRWDYMLDPENGIGYVRITNFMESTAQELREALSELNARGAKGVVLDLRFNPGGLLKTAVDVSDMFLPREKIVVQTQGRSPGTHNEIRSRHTDREFTRLPLIVLVNDYSASASEIVSGAIKDHHRGMVIGERTFGKGSVQNLIRIDEQGGPPSNASAFLKLTTAYYLLPSNRCLHRTEDSVVWGVDPDVPVKLCPKELAYLLENRRETEVLRGKNQSADEKIEDTLDQSASGPDEDKIDADAQLEAALLVMRVRLLSHQEWPLAETGVALRDASPERSQKDLAAETP